MIHFDSMADAEGKGTILSSSIKPFQEVLDSPFSQSPVEACWNGIEEKYNTKKEIVEEKVSFRRLNYVCLRPFSSNYKCPTDAFLMKITNRGERDATRIFYEYLFSPASPWAGVQKSLATVGNIKHGTPEAILWYDTSNSCSKLVMNLLTTMRLHTCWGLDYIWFRLVQAGFTHEEAILLSTNFSWGGQHITIGNGSPCIFSNNPYEQTYLARLGVSATDMPFLTNYNPSGFAPLLKDKKPSFSGKSLKEKQKVQPNSFIWNADATEISADALNKCSPEYENSMIRLAKNTTPLYSFLKTEPSTSNKLSKDYVAKVKHKLHNNELLEV